MLLNRVDAYFIHPEQIELKTSIKPIQDIYDYTIQWANANPEKLNKASKYTGEVEHAETELKELIDKGDASFNFLVEMYQKYGN